MNPSFINPATKAKLQQLLLGWYTVNKRDLPWRKTKDPYKIWVSEVMLQQTQVEQVVPYYKRFLKKFPTLYELAKADPDSVLKMWEGLGYYRRARYLQQAAKIIIQNFAGDIPQQYESLKTLPGFGPYTCGSVLSIAYNVPQPAIDGNVTRFITRLFRIEADTARLSTKKQIEGIVRQLFPIGQVSDFTQALMEIGAMVCTPFNPVCGKCCVSKFCRAYNEIANPAILPIKKPKKRGDHFHIATAVVKKGNHVLIARRPENVILGNLWEFPGGKKEKRERLESACIRELSEKTGILAKIDRPVDSVRHHYSHYSVTLHFFLCKYIRGGLRDKNIRWVKIQDLEKYAFPKVHKQMARKIMDGSCS